MDQCELTFAGIMFVGSPTKSPQFVLKKTTDNSILDFDRLKSFLNLQIQMIHLKGSLMDVRFFKEIPNFV